MKLLNISFGVFISSAARERNVQQKCNPHLLLSETKKARCLLGFKTKVLRFVLFYRHAHIRTCSLIQIHILLLCIFVRGKGNGNKLALSFLIFLSDIIGIKLLMGDT